MGLSFGNAGHHTKTLAVSKAAAKLFHDPCRSHGTASLHVPRSPPGGVPRLEITKNYPGVKPCLSPHRAIPVWTHSGSISIGFGTEIIRQLAVIQPVPPCLNRSGAGEPQQSCTVSHGGGLVPASVRTPGVLVVYSLKIKRVGLARFELTTSCTPCKRSTKLSYSPRRS